MKGGIKQLDERLSRFVRASSTIASYHCAVEEVILNSIDSQSRSVDIVLDVESCSFVVTDDGNGVDTVSFENIGEWNHTSKTNNSLHSATESDAAYGMKGEALASIRALSYMEIESSPRSSSLVHRKQFDREGNSQLWTVDPSTSQHSFQQRQLCGQQNHGTTVSVYDLFHNLPVRRKVLRSESEISSIKEFVQNMSILHHTISWTLSTACLTASSSSGSMGSSVSGTVGTQRNVLLRLPSQVSVAKRYIGYHGLQNMLNMQEVCHQTGSFAVQGFLSPPLLHCCLPSREGQHLYLNGRWLRNSDKLSCAIDTAYGRLLGMLSGSAGGMNARHAAPHGNPSQVGSTGYSGTNHDSGKSGVHPCFVLQVTCSAAEYDVLSDPDKSVAVFRNEASALRCVEEVVGRLLQEHWPERYSELVHLVFAESASRMGVLASYCATAGFNGALVKAQQGLAQQREGEHSASDNEDDEAPMSVRQLEHYSVVTAGTLTGGNSARLHQQSQSQPQLGLSKPSPHSALFASAFFSGPTTPLSAQKQCVPPAGKGHSYSVAPTAPTVAIAGLKGLLGSPYADSPYSPYTCKPPTYDHTRRASETPEHLRNPAVKRMITAVVGREDANTKVTGAESVSMSHSIGGDMGVDQYDMCTSSPQKRARRDVGGICSGVIGAGTHLWAENSPIKAEVGVNVRRLSFSPDIMLKFPHLDPQLDPQYDTQYNDQSEYAHQVPYTEAGSYEYTSQYPMGCGDPELDTSDPTTVMAVTADRGASSFPWSHYAHSPQQEDFPTHNTGTEAGARMSTTQEREYVECWDDTRQSFRSPVDSPPHTVDAQWAARSPESPMQPLRHPPSHPLALLVSRDSAVALGDITADIASECGAAIESNQVDGGDTVAAVTLQRDHSAVLRSEQSQRSGWSSAVVTSRDVGEYLQHTLRRPTSNTALDTTAVNTTTDHGNSTQLPQPSRIASIATNMDLPTSLPATAEVTLNKAKLRDHMQCIGQADRKFLIARTCCCAQLPATAISSHSSATADAHLVSTTDSAKWCVQCGNSSLLLVLDQHAVDERIQYESLCQALCTAGRAGRTSVAAAGAGGTNTLALSARESEVLLSRTELLAAWGFGYTVHDPTDTAAAIDNAADGIAATGRHTTTITVNTVPTILNEPLVAADLREFIQHIAAHRELPDALLSPPAVQRIVASRACHSAVRFGDALDAQRCDALLRQLMRTELPFQCAHGRPSMAPVLDMRELHRHKRRELGLL